MMRAVRLAGVLALAYPAAGRAQAFDHLKHAKLFPTCTVCHAGIETAGQPIWPDSASCATCHDGTVQERITWQTPESLRTNLRFDHARHRRYATAKPAGCMNCHSEAGAPWMAVRPPVPGRCFACHGLQTAHLAAPDTACATCHLPLAAATALRRADVAALDTPPSHHRPDFVTGAGHGALATAPGGGISASCATCHARDFCLTCHVDAPEQPVIQALARDPRATAIPAHLEPPPSHGSPAFLVRHGRSARADVRRCSTCHTRGSCLACHRGTARVAAALPARSGERGIGAVITRRPPPSHTLGFEQRHAAEASAASNSCAGCHARADCLECHRPTAATASGYHPAGWLARHPAEAYARASDCSDCHNTGSFCVSCHAQAGLRSTGLLVGSGYHDAKRFFGLGHGQAARQSLETCVGCHVERDCLTCHASFGGRRFNPHGPGFDAARLKRKNPQMCTACHGTNIPG